VSKPNNERRNAVEKDKRLEPTSFTVSASSIIVNSPEKAKRFKQLNKKYNNSKRQRKSIVKI